MTNLQLFEKFILANDKNSPVNKFSSYAFSKKIKQDKEYAKYNALNIKESIAKACDWIGDKSSQIFLFEISIIETSLGCSNKSSATRGNIGRSVWHIDQGTFEDTKKSPKLEQYRDRLLKYGLDWQKVQWNDLSLNLLLGAVGAKLVLLLKDVNQVVSPLEKRAVVYADKYNGGGTREAKINYVNNCRAWYNYLYKLGAEYLEFNGTKYDITKKGLALNNTLV